MTLSHGTQRTGRALLTLAAVAGALAGCQSAPVDPDDGMLRVRVERDRGTLLVTNTGSDSIVVGVIGRAISAVAFRIPCGYVRIGPRRSARLEIPPRETEAIVYYCALPLPEGSDIPPERTLVVNFAT